ncbi:MAG: hypothetical protein HFE63_04200 [Clostridiales bacterium]|nr:hypothetical protein [Clostridiales bacterium]
MIRFVGSLLVFISCTLVGFSAAKMYRLRVMQLEAFVRLIAHIKAQIEYYRAPLDRIFDGYESELICEFIDGARKYGAAEAFVSCRNRMYVSESEADELEKFFAGLGMHNVGEESSHCAYFEKRLGELLSSARGEIDKRAKLCRTFGILIGFLIAILLW